MHEGLEGVVSLASMAGGLVASILVARRIRRSVLEGRQGRLSAILAHGVAIFPLGAVPVLLAMLAKGLCAVAGVKIFVSHGSDGGGILVGVAIGGPAVAMAVAGLSVFFLLVQGAGDFLDSRSR
jgi:hypothetical protein